MRSDNPILQDMINELQEKNELLRSFDNPKTSYEYDEFLGIEVIYGN